MDITWRVSEYEELVGLLTGNEDCLQRLTERTFYGVPTLSGLRIRETLSVLSRSSGIVVRRGRYGVTLVSYFTACTQNIQLKCRVILILISRNHSLLLVYYYNYL